MSEAIAFDTHRFVKRLTDSGFTERQAETLADEHVALLNANLATKADIAALKADNATIKIDIETLRKELKTDIAALRNEFKTDIAALRNELKTDIAKVEAGLKADIAKVDARIETVKADLLKWMFGALVAQGGLIVALVKLL